jgi:hypothetical protein
VEKLKIHFRGDEIQEKGIGVTVLRIQISWFNTVDDVVVKGRAPLIGLLFVPGGPVIPVGPKGEKKVKGQKQ